MSEGALEGPSAEIDRYLAQADGLKYGDFQQLLLAAEKASVRAQALGDFRRYALALTHQAWAYVQLNEYERSLTRALEVLLLARSNGFVDIEAQVVGIVGANFFGCGIRQEAIYLYEYQRALGEQILSAIIQAMALNDLATVKLETGENEAAIGLLRRALELMPSDTHRGLDRSIVHLNMAIACVNVRQFDEAALHAQQVLTRVTDMPRLSADAYLCMAEIALGRGDLHAARGQLERARATVDNAVPPLYSDNVEQMSAELLNYEGRYEEAAQVWERMYTMALQQHQLDFSVSALNHAKDAYERIGDSASVIGAYKRLVEDIPRLQKQGDDLRFTVLRMVFAMDKAALQANLQLTRQKNAILERLSHEFRTPLAIIQSAAQIVDQYGDQMTLDQRQDRLRSITAQVQWMTVMLEDILQLLKADDHNGTTIPATPFQLDSLARGAVAELDRYRMSKSRVRIQTSPDVETVSGPQKFLRPVLVHLLTNALKFSQTEVLLDLSVEGQSLVTRVIDQGIGIRKDDLETIFKPLVRGSNLNEVNGAGLGLAIVAKLVEQMQGTIDLSSVEGKGTTVIVRVPLASVEYVH